VDGGLRRRRRARHRRFPPQGSALIGAAAGAWQFMLALGDLR
jgi:hypothetical protein